MTHRYLIFWCIFVVETCCGTILTDIKRLNVEAAQYPDTLHTFNQFSGGEKKIEDETRNEPDNDPPNLRDEASLTTICSQISQYIKANLKHVISASNRCEVELQESEYTLVILATHEQYVGFWKYFTGKLKPKSRYPIRIDIIGQGYRNKAKDMIFYDASREEVHFETRYGPLRHLRQYAKKPSTFPKNEYKLFDKLNEIAEKHKNMDDTTHEATAELKKIVSSYMALHIGAIYQHQRAGSYYFWLPAPGFQIKIHLPVLISNIEEIFGLHFGRTTWNPVYVYRLRYVYFEAEQIVGKYPEDTYFYDVKYRTHGTLEDFSSRYDTLKKILK